MMSQVLAHGGIAALSVALVVAVDTGAEMVNPELAPRHLELARFEYADGHFTQQLVSSNGQPIAAHWTAQISRPAGNGIRPVCTGSGAGVYNGSVDIYSADEWVGDDCPDLMAGDIAEVTWEYRNQYDLIVSVGAAKIIPE